MFLFIAFKKKFQKHNAYFYPWTFWSGTQIFNMIYEFFS
jgi:hypothetical protein